MNIKVEVWFSHIVSYPPFLSFYAIIIVKNKTYRRGKTNSNFLLQDNTASLKTSFAKTSKEQYEKQINTQEK